MVTPEIRNIVLIALFQQITVHLCNGGRFLIIASNMETLDAQALRNCNQLRKTRIDPFFSLRLLLRPGKYLLCDEFRHSDYGNPVKSGLVPVIDARRAPSIHQKPSSGGTTYSKKPSTFRLPL